MDCIWAALGAPRHHKWVKAGFVMIFGTWSGPKLLFGASARLKTADSGDFPFPFAGEYLPHPWTWARQQTASHTRTGRSPSHSHPKKILSHSLVQAHVNMPETPKHTNTQNMQAHPSCADAEEGGRERRQKRKSSHFLFPWSALCAGRRRWPLGACGPWQHGSCYF